MSTDITQSNNDEVVSATPNPTSSHKKLSRRKMLALAGSGTFVLVAGGGVWRAADQGVFGTGQGPACEPWDDWRTISRGPLDLVRAAILAANPQEGDSNRWYRPTWQDLQQRRDGITLDAAGLPDLTRAIGKMLPPASQEQQDSTFLTNTATQAQTASAFDLLAVRDVQNRAQQLRAGQLWERMHLWVTKEGLAMQPLNAVVERAAREVVLGITPHFGTALATLVGDPAWKTLLALRSGPLYGRARAAYALVGSGRGLSGGRRDAHPNQGGGHLGSCLRSVAFR